MEVQLEKARLRKKMKVKISLDSKFVDIEQIRRTQLAAEEAITIVNDKKESSKSDPTLDCIEIK